MKRLAVIPALALAILPFVPTVAANAATGDLTTVSITVSMDLPSSSSSSGPMVFQVTDVPVGAGPELTGADIVSNPSEWGGSVTVDVDNADHTITVATEDADTFETTTVTVTGPGLGDITLVSDTLWLPPQQVPERHNADPATQADAAEMALTYNSAGETSTIDWTSTIEGTYFGLNPDGAAVFSFTQVTPTSSTTTTAAPTTTTTAAPVAVAATPQFTG